MVEKLMQFTEIEKLFDDFLLYNIEIYHNDKLLKSGKLKMVTVKNHYIKLFIEECGNIRQLELFYPFNYEKNNNQIIFDYYINTLTKGNKLLNLKISNYKTETPSKFLNSKVTIKIKN